MRFGEATALKWADVDEANLKIVIRRAQWKGKVDTTKTGIIRSVPLSPELVEVCEPTVPRSTPVTSVAGVVNG